MSAGAVVIAIVVGLGEAKSPGTVAMLSAARESLAEGAVVRLVEKMAPNEVNAAALERELGAGATVVVTWKDVGRQHALLRVHLPAGDRWFSQSIDFSIADGMTERGRTLGLTAASIWPEPGQGRRTTLSAGPPKITSSPWPSSAARSSPPASDAPMAAAATDRARAEVARPESPRPESPRAENSRAESPRSENGPAPAPEPRRSAELAAGRADEDVVAPREITLSSRWRPEPRRSADAKTKSGIQTAGETSASEDQLEAESFRQVDDAVDPVRTTTRRASPPSAPSRPHTYVVQLDSIASAGFGHPAPGLGAGLRAAFFPASLGLGICAGVRGRTGSVSVPGWADIRNVAAGVSFGLEWWPGDGRLRSGVDDVPELLSLGLRIEGLLTYDWAQDASGHFVGQDKPSYGGELAAQVRLRLSAHLHVLVTGALEGLSGELIIRNEVTPGQFVEKQRIAAWRGVGELGLRFVF